MVKQKRTKKRVIVRIPKIYKKNGRRYIRIKGKRIYLDNDISERELIKFVISKLAPRKRKSRSTTSKAKETVYTGPKMGMSASQQTFFADQISKSKQEVEETKKQLQKLLTDNGIDAKVKQHKQQYITDGSDQPLKNVDYVSKLIDKDANLYAMIKKEDIPKYNKLVNRSQNLFKQGVSMINLNKEARKKAEEEAKKCKNSKIKS